MFLVPESPLDAALMGSEEKDAFRAALASDGDQRDPHSNGGSEERATFSSIFGRSYLYAFAVYSFCSSFTYFTSIQTAPFYLRNVLGASIELISVWMTFMGIAGEIDSPFISSKLFSNPAYCGTIRKYPIS